MEFPDVLKIASNALISGDRLEFMYHILNNRRSATGEIWECGVYRGGVALLMGMLNPTKTIRIFDTFEGMPEHSSNDNHHRKGDFSDTSLDYVQNLVKNYPNVKIYKGFIPDTFKGLEESKIVVAHIDVDLYESTKNSLEFVFPRLTTDGVIVLDDYNQGTCKGVKIAINEFCAANKCILVPTAMSTAIIFK